MTKLFSEAISVFEQSEDNLNAARQKLFSECNNNLFASKYHDPYEEQLENYFFNLSRLFENDRHSKELEESLDSDDPHTRRSVLQIIKDGFLSDCFMQKIARKLLMLAINSNDDDRITSMIIFARKYKEKSILIDILPDCVFQSLNKPQTHSDDDYYLFQNIWHLMLKLNATHLFKEHIRFGENHENPHVRELAADFKIDMEQHIPK